MMSVTLEDAAALATCYMPFLKQGGIFIPTSQKMSLYDKVEVLLSLLTCPESIWIPGTVIWLTPAEMEDGRQPGFGLQFEAIHAAMLRDKIGVLLKDLPENGLRHTL